MEILKEVTVWDSEFQPNHTYLLSGKGNIIAYAKNHGDEVFVSPSGKITLNKSRRKFITSKHLGLLKVMKSVSKPIHTNPQWSILSDSGKTYTVELDNGKYTCSCPGHKYRGKCKHTELVAKKQQEENNA
jgi:hypothetical protein